MRAIRSLIIVCAAVALMAGRSAFAQDKAAPAAGAGDAILLRYQVFRVLDNLSGDTTLEENIWVGGRRPDEKLKKALTFFTGAKLKVGENRLTAGEKGWFWNGAPLPLEGKLPALPERGFQPIASPKILVTSGQNAAVDITSNQKLEYFELHEGDLYRLKKLEEPTGLSLGVLAEKVGDRQVALRDLTFALRWIEKREPLANVNLQVGKPILQERKFKTDLQVTAGKDYGILFHPGDGQGLLLIRLRAELGVGPESKG